MLEIEVARKRIALTLRLDDETGAKSERKQQEKPRDIPAKSMTSSSQAKQPSAGGALAEAMRRAAEKNGGPKA